jgi:hypothetical protein
MHPSRVQRREINPQLGELLILERDVGALLLGALRFSDGSFEGERRELEGEGEAEDVDTITADRFDVVADVAALGRLRQVCGAVVEKSA